jgi:hypothetical protein
MLYIMKMVLGNKGDGQMVTVNSLYIEGMEGNKNNMMGT